MQATRILTTAAALLAIWAVTGAQAQMDATFTYQGYLESNGEPANYSGAAMTFELYDVDSGGTSLGTLNLSEVLVEDGTFIVALDFGADVFDGSDRWLAITVEGTLLSPRQRITATPHATLAGTLAVPALLQSDSDYTLRIEGDGILAGNVLEVYANPDAGNVKSALRATFAPNLNTAKLGNPAAAIWGQAHSGSALLAEHIPTGNTVTLGNGTYGVYSHVTDPANWAGWFEGRSYFSDAVGIGTDTPEDASLHVVSTGRRGVRVHTTDGIYCVSGEAWGTTAVSVQGYHHGVGVGVRGHSGSGVGVYGISQSDLGVRGFNLSTDTIGYLAGPDYAVYGEHPDGGFAGYFDGNLYASGNVGIGTTTPTEALTVAGTVESTAGGFKFPDGTVQTTASTGGGDSPWDQFGSNIYYNDGNVGIGTSFPDTQLELRSDRAWMRLTSMTHTSGSIIEMQSKIPGNTTLGAINFMNDLGSTRSQINGQTGALLLHALDEYGTLKTRLTLDDDGHVGIGTTTPTEALTVVGTVESTAGGFKFPDGTVQTTAASGGSGGYWNENGSDIYYSNGNVGIGTSTPSENLVVGEDLGANYNGNRIVIGDATSGADTGLVVGEGADERGYLLWNVGESIFRLGSVVGGVSHSNTLVLNEGNVGIGTSAPGGVFHASGGDSGGSAWYDTYDFIFENDNHSVVNIVAPPEYKSEIAFSDTVRGRGAIRYVHSDDSMDFRTGGVNGRMVIDAGGNVGIGTTSPEQPLDVNGDTSIGGGASAWDGGTEFLKIRGRAADWYVGIGNEADPNDAYFYIGDGAGSHELRILPNGHVTVPGQGSTDSVILSPTESGNQNGFIELYNSLGNRTIKVDAEEPLDDAGVIFVNNASGTTTVKLDGNSPNGVGRVTTDELLITGQGSTDSIMLSPTESGDENGFIELYNSLGNRTIKVDAEEPSDDAGVIFVSNASGTTTVKLDGNSPNGVGRVTTDELMITGADLAEKFPTATACEPGMLMEIDPEAPTPGQLRLTQSAYSKLVAGVVSGANGLRAGAVLGNVDDGECHAPIALTGRVWVHCDASRAGIEPGDLLTTSDIPGHAMRVLDYEAARGAVIGKAMTPLAEGRGLVLVLVQPQ